MFIDKIETRRNPKTQQVQYRAAFGVKLGGKWQNRRTGWCSSEDAAKETAAVAKAKLIRKDKQAACLKKTRAMILNDESPNADEWSYYKLAELNILLAGHLPALDDVEQRAIASDGKNYLSDEEYGAVVIRFLFYTGLRFEELQALKWKDIQFGDHAIHVERVYRPGVSDNSGMPAAMRCDSARVIPMYPQVEEWLGLLFNIRTMHAASKSEAWHSMIDQLVFPSYRYPDRMMTPNGIQHWLDVFAAEKRMPRISIHGLRHSCAEWQCWYRGMPKEIAKLFFGNADAEMLDQVYAVSDQEKRAAALLWWESKNK